MYYAEQSNFDLTESHNDFTTNHDNVVALENPDSIFQPSNRPSNPHTVWVNFVDQIKTQRKHSPEETLEVLKYLGNIRQALTTNLLRLPSIQKFILEKHNIDIGRKNSTSSIIRGYNIGLFGDAQTKVATDRGIPLTKIIDAMELLSSTFSCFVESFHDNGPAHFTTIKHKRFLDESFKALIPTHLGLEKLIAAYANPASCDEVTVLPSASLLDDAKHSSLCTEIDGLLEDYNRLAQEVAHSNMMLVVKELSKHKYLDADGKRDKANEGFLALVDSAKRFDSSKNIRFSTHATYWIKYFFQCNHVSNKHNAKRNEHYSSFLNKDLYSERKTNLVISDSHFISNQYVEGFESNIAIEDQESEESSFEHVSAKESSEIILQALNGLKRQQRFVLQMKYGIGVPQLSVKEIAAETGLTTERIRQIESAASAEIRSFLDKQGISAEGIL